MVPNISKMIIPKGEKRNKTEVMINNDKTDILYER